MRRVKGKRLQMSYDLVTVNAERHTVLPCSATGFNREGKYAVQMHKSGNLPFMGTETAMQSQITRY